MQKSDWGGEIKDPGEGKISLVFLLIHVGGILPLRIHPCPGLFFNLTLFSEVCHLRPPQPGGVVGVVGARGQHC